MTEPYKVHCYARIDRPYESVRGALHGLLEGGTAAPVTIHSVYDERGAAGLPNHTRATVGIKDDAAHESRLISAELYASPLSPSDTRIEIEGHCVGREHDSVNATATGMAGTHVRSLLEDLVERIRRELKGASEPSAHDS